MFVPWNQKQMWFVARPQLCGWPRVYADMPSSLMFHPIPCPCTLSTAVPPLLPTGIPPLMIPFTDHPPPLIAQWATNDLVRSRDVENSRSCKARIVAELLCPTGIPLGDLLWPARSDTKRWSFVQWRSGEMQLPRLAYANGRMCTQIVKETMVMIDD